VFLVAVLGLCAVLYGTDLGAVAFLGKDEPKNAQAAREMLERGDWVLTSLAGEPWYDKPILYYWTAIVGYHLFGVGELGARIGPALAALLTVLLTFVLGRRYLGDPRGGALAALVLGTGLEFVILARMAVTDSLLACFVTGSLVAYLLAREGVRPGWNVHLFWASAAAATLAKGPVGLVLPLMVAGVDLLLERDATLFRKLRWLSGPLVLLAVAGPWYALAIHRSDGRFFQDFILHYNVERFTTENLPHPGPWYYYLPVLLLGPFPWSVFLPTGAIRIARTFRSMPPERRSRCRFLLLWVALPVVFFSMAGSKLPSYLLPTFPALAVLLAGEIRLLLHAPGRGLPRPLAVAGAVFSVIAGGLAGAAVYYLQVDEPTLLPAAMPLVGVLAFTALAMLAALLLRRRTLVVTWVGAFALLVPLALIHWVSPALEERASAKEIALMGMALEPAPGRFLAYRFYDNSWFFYTDCTVERMWARDALQRRFQELGGGEALLYVRDFDLYELGTFPEIRVEEEVGAVGMIHLLRVSWVPPEARAG
jgi:4-amino-4-deoxy-L-arabinose transferase-like glycosyltransferase